jgi:hypothetical protein
MKIIRITLNGRGGELDSRMISADNGDDSLEVSNMIHEAIEDWILSPGDTIKVMRVLETGNEQ